MVSDAILKMNGDYVRFFYDEKNRVSVAVTDVVGKGGRQQFVCRW